MLQRPRFIAPTYRVPSNQQIGALAAFVIVGITLGVAAAASPSALSPPPTSVGGPQVVVRDRTSRVEALRVDRVPAPSLTWRPCQRATGAFFKVALECATALLPLDYDHPEEATTDVALLRLRSTGRAPRLGSLFMNPGGPGLEARGFAGSWFSDDRAIRDRYDLVGLDPRGTSHGEAAGASVSCFAGEQGRNTAVPSLAQSSSLHASFSWQARGWSSGCARHGGELVDHLSTANVARDLDVMRRALGDRRLNFYGLSYGSYLGAVYANLFPDRVGRLVLDGIVDPVAWAGSARTRSTPMNVRLGYPQAVNRAVKAYVGRCDAVGPALCPFAPDGQRKLRSLVARLERHSVTVGTTPAGPQRLTAAGLMAYLEGAVSSRAQRIPPFFAALAAASALTSGATSAADRNRAERTLARLLPPAAAFPQPDASDDVGQLVQCEDSLDPVHAGPAFAAVEQIRPEAGLFTGLAFPSAGCADDVWSQTDQDAYRGDFQARSATPILILGTLHDPETPYRGAQRLARLMPGSRLLTIAGFGHASGTFVAGDTVDAYLATGELPPAGAVRRDPVQPFGR